MVSFFGLKFGSKGKLQKKQQKKEENASQWKKGNEWSFAEDQFYGHNLSRPSLPLSRPGTSQSSHSGHMSFRPPYAGNNGASSSMVDLSNSARRPSVTSLRPISSNPAMNKGSRPAISSPIGPPITTTNFPGGGGSRPGTPTRPGTAGAGNRPSTPTRPGTSGGGVVTKAWAGPNDGQHNKDASSHGAGFSRTNTAPTAKSPLSAAPAPGPGNLPRTNTAPVRSPLSQFESKVVQPPNQQVQNRQPQHRIGPHGTPSPPPSITNFDRRTPSISSSPNLHFDFPSAPASLRPGTGGGETSSALPSPPASNNDELWTSPVPAPAPTTRARRETLTFHNPRRKSISRTAAETQQQHQPAPVVDSGEEKEAIKKRRQTEGFEGNFSAFDFGSPAVDNSIPLPTAPAVFTNGGAETPADSPSASPLLDGRKTARERGMRDPMTPESIDDEKVVLEDVHRVASTESNYSSSSHHQHHLLHQGQTLQSQSQSLQSQVYEALHSRGDSDTRSPGSPTTMQSPKKEASGRKGSIPSSITIPPKLNPEPRPASPLMAKIPMEGDFPVTNGLPRGRMVGSPTTASPYSQQQFPPPEAPDDEALIVASWADRTERHMSAMPAPLSPIHTGSFLDDKELSPWATTSNASSPTAPPQLPSPTFTSLEKSISNSSENLARSFELSAPPKHMYDVRPMSPSRGEYRVEAKKAPPRPPPIALPPGQRSGRGTPNGVSPIALGSPVKVSSGYI